MYTIEWSADYLVVGSLLAGSPIIPKAGSYATMLMLLISSIDLSVKLFSKINFYTPSKAPAD